METGVDRRVNTEARFQPDASWTAGPAWTGRSEGLHEAFGRHAGSRPGAIALVSNGAATTYGELDAAADGWATELVRRGVGPGHCVPILLPRGAALVTSLLAVLKTGAAYALLDPTWPARRLQEVAGELETPVLVTKSGGTAPPGRPVWSPPAGRIAAAAGFRPMAVTGSHPCCVFFTSGTTGRPKGVLTPHRATARLFQADTFARFTAETVMPLASPVAWDAFSLELWAALLNGGTSLIVDEPYLSPAALRNGVSRHGVDTVWLTSSLFNLIVDEDPDAFLGVAQVMAGGERLSVAAVERFLRRHPGITLLNGYGPVESTVFATTHRVREVDLERPDGIPLGRPVTGTQVYVLDGSRLCDVGETGEICIGGEGLALRYLNDPGLTEAKFTRVDVEDRPRRLYRTGDLGTWSDDGLLHFRGRADRQVKIRGHRVEPAEVERQIERLLPDVRSCRVVARPDSAGQAQELIAFCIPTDPGRSLAEAPAALRSALVSYQQPAAVVCVDAFPLTAQGKLDERALLAMAPRVAECTPAAPVLPSDGDALVRLVAQAFGSVLGRAHVPLDVPFFELGGSSLEAGRVCARLGARLERPVPLAWLYEDASAAALAARLRAASPGAPGVSTAGTLDEVPLTPMQLVFLIRHLADPSERTGHCLLAWTVEGDLDHAALEGAIWAVHERHEALRAAYVADPAPAARLVDAPPPPLEVLPSQASADAAVQALRAELAGPLDPGEGQVWRTVLAPVDGENVALFGCAVHHIAFDGWSESVLAKDLAAAYGACRGSGPALAPLPASPAAPAASRRDAAREDELRREFSAVPALCWPAGSTRPPGGEPGRIELALSPAVVRDVEALAASAGVTRFVVLLHQFAKGLAGLTGQRDFCLGFPVRLRHRTDLEPVVGCHIGMFCLRPRGAALDSGLAALRETGRLVRQAFAWDVPFPDLLALTKPPRTPRPPLFQALFALQDNPAPHLDLDGLRTTFLRQPYLELPLELHAELWPEEEGGMRLGIYFRREAVPETAARELATRMSEGLRR